MLHISTLDPSTYQLLRDLFKIPCIKETFALAGGTSLALQIGHRKSIDLDFFSNSEFNVKELEIILQSNKNNIFQYAGNNSRMLFGFISKVKCDFIHEPAKLINPYLEIENVKYFSVEDIAAMKLHTICGLGKKKDFFDIYALLQIYNWETLLGFFTTKYDQTQLFYLWRSIVYFDDAENDPDIIGIFPFNKNWEEVKKYISTVCQ